MQLQESLLPLDRAELQMARLMFTVRHMELASHSILLSTCLTELVKQMPFSETLSPFKSAWDHFEATCI